MITRRIARPLSAFSPQSWTCPACYQTRTSLRQNLQNHLQRRRVHQIPPLYHHETFSTRGVPGLFTKQGYALGWTQYQSMIIQKLNELIAGEPIENKDARGIAIQFARDPMNASLFNHASMAHNNHFFYEALSTKPLEVDKYPQIKESLEQTFGSMETLRITMLDTAAAMFGPGFVWLVWARDTTSGRFRKGDWRVLTTYLAGTPYPEAGHRQQGIDMNSNNALSYSAYVDSQPVNYPAKFGPYSERGAEEAKIPPGGTKVMPVLCVNTWEHVYLYDYGLPGKRKYLSDWWDAVDWGIVNGRTPSEVKKPDPISQGYA